MRTRAPTGLWRPRKLRAFECPRRQALASHTLARNLVAAGHTWRWGASHAGELRGPVAFRANGTLDSPFGRGTWGAVPGPWRKDAVHVILSDGGGGGDSNGGGGGGGNSSSGNSTYLLMFLSEKWAFVAVRCSDEQVSYGRVEADPIPEQRLVW